MWPFVRPKGCGHCPHGVHGRLFILHFRPFLPARVHASGRSMRHDLEENRCLSPRDGLIGCPTGHSLVLSAARPFLMTCIHVLRR